MGDTSRLPPAIVAQIYGRYGTRSEWNTRGSLRFPLRCCNAVARRDVPDAEMDPFEIEIVDVAVGGIGLRTHTPVAVGMLLTVELQPPNMPRQTWRCRVVNVHGFDEQRYHVGAQFCVVPNG